MTELKRYRITFAQSIEISAKNKERAKQEAIKDMIIVDEIKEKSFNIWNIWAFFVKLFFFMLYVFAIVFAFSKLVSSISINELAFWVIVTFWLISMTRSEIRRIAWSWSITGIKERGENERIRN